MPDENECPCPDGDCSDVVVPGPNKVDPECPCPDDCPDDDCPDDDCDCDK